MTLDSWKQSNTGLVSWLHAVSLPCWPGWTTSRVNSIPSNERQSLMRGFQKVVKCKPSACISALLRCAYGNSKLHLRKHGLSCSMQINLSAAVKLGNISSVRLQYLGSPNFAKFFLVHHYYQGNVLHVPAKPCTSISNNFVVNSHVTKTRNSTASNIARAITRTYLVTPQAVRVRVQ